MSLPIPSGRTVLALFVVYVGMEVLFYLVFQYVLIPRANRLITPPVEYRDYGRDRAALMLRILERIRATCAMTGENVQERSLKFLSEWFHTSGAMPSSSSSSPCASPAGSDADCPDSSPTPSSSPENSDDDYDEDVGKIKVTTSDIVLFKEDMQDFFGWAFFAKSLHDLDDWEIEELAKLFVLLDQKLGLSFPPTPSNLSRESTRKPRRMTLESVNAIHRPFLVYLLVYGMKLAGRLFLRFQGFQRYQTPSGLLAWYRPPTCSVTSEYLPLLFFHGIAPGGLMLYLPMILYGLATERNRPVYLFENHSISCTLNFNALTEEDTVRGVHDVLKKFGHDTSLLSLVGHSFGSCPITWLLASRQLKIAQVALLDPVTILLSEPDVMVNFLYAEELDKIRMVASSELFTEYYLRRHFAWFNSELWLEDVPPATELLVCLSEQDEIIHAGKVRSELERHATTGPEGKVPSMRVVYWKNVGHGDSISSPAKWREVKQLLLEQELKVLQKR